MTMTPGQRRYARGPEGRMQAFEEIVQRLRENPKVRPDMRQQLNARKVMAHYDRLIKEYKAFVEYEKRASGQQVTLTERQAGIFPLIKEALNYQTDGAFYRSHADGATL